MNILQLLESTKKNKGINGYDHYKPDYAFKSKEFGQIYFYNKTVKTKPGFSIIEVSMMIKAVTDRNRSNHKVMIAISGVHQETVRGTTLIDRMRALDLYKDTEAFSDEQLLAIALEKKPFPEKTVIKNETGNYTIIDDNISVDSEIIVNCSCSDYYWTWQYYNVEKNVDIFNEKPPKYSPRTSAGKEGMKTNQPVRNPGRNPGMCKHIMLLLALLMDTDTKNPTNLLQEAKGITKYYRANLDRFQKVDRMSPEEFRREMRKWEREQKDMQDKRGFDSDPVLAPKRQQRGLRHWQIVQNTMVGKKSRKR